MANVEATMAICDSCPVMARKAYCKETTPEVDENQHRGERPVDEGAVYDHIYIVEAILQHCESDSQRYPSEA